MYCPLCKTVPMARKDLEEHLAANECGKCGGHWVSSTSYWKWLENRGRELSGNPLSDISHQVEDSKKAKICPDCGHILIKFKVGHGIDFYLDHCNCCNGVWLDKNEWMTLKSRGLHDDLHSIFTTSWQKQIRDNELAELLEKGYREKFGDGYGDLKKVKQWLENHPEKSMILAYLNNPNPYKL